MSVSSSPVAGDASSSDSSSSTSNTVSPPTTEAIPKNLPTIDHAIQTVTAWLDDLGLNQDTSVVTGTKSDYSTDVKVTLKVDGVVTDLFSYFSFGENAELMSANGNFVDVKSVGKYPLISPRDAVARISSSIVEPMMARGMPTSDSTVPASTISISKADLALTVRIVDNNDVYLVPAYSLSTDAGEAYVVPAVEDKYLQADAGSSSTTASSGSTSGSNSGSTGAAPDTPISKADAQLLVGLTEQGANDMAVKNGWTVRVAVRDGRSFMLTTDYVPNRVNLTIGNGIVTSVVVG